MGRELTALAQEMDLAVIHDLAVRGSEANIDHLVIGPAGVTVVDAKAWTGAVWIGEKTIRRGKFSSYGELVGVQQQIERVRNALSRAEVGDVPVDGLMCMVNANAGVPTTGLRRSAGVGIGTIPSVRRHVARPGALDVADIQRIHDVLSAHFVVSGGGFRPGLPSAPAYRPVAPDELLRKLIDENAGQIPRRKRRGRSAPACAAIVAFIAVIVVGLSGIAGPSPAPPMTMSELRAMKQDLRAIAADRARGRVRGPAIRRTPTQFSLRFRRGKRCRVRITIDRADRSQSVRSAGCAARR